MQRVSWTEEMYRIIEVDSDYEPNLSRSIDFCAPEARPVLVHTAQRAIDHGESFDLELPFITTKGNRLWVHMIGHARQHNGKTFKVLGAFQDITERKKAEQELQKLQKLDSIGILAGGIAHDFNNMLGAMLGYTNLAQLDIADKDKTLDYLASIQNAISKATHLTQQLLTFSTGGTPVKELIDLKELIKEATGFALTGSNVKAEHRLGEDLLSVNADKGQMGQVIGNIVINANHAMPSGGTIKILAENVCLEKGNKLALKEGKYVKMAIQDKGIGIPEEDLTNIFDPFFTTKAKGHGLGLSTAYSIIKNHDGTITVDSDLGVGTTFEIYLPASQKQAFADKETEKAFVSGNGKILVMDDDEDMRESISKLLTVIGYEAVEAKDGAEGIKLYKAAMKSSSPVDVAILDLTVRGGMGGKETMKKLLKIDPDAKAIVLSGYSNDDVLGNYRKYGFKGAIPKPCDQLKLTKTISWLIEKKKGS